VSNATRLEFVSCALCGSVETELLYQSYDLWHELDAAKRPRYNIVRCRRCGLCYVNPRVSPDSMSLFYPEDYVSHSVALVEPKLLSPWGEQASRWRRELFELWLNDNRVPTFRRLTLSLIGRSRRIRYDPLRFPGDGRRLLDIGCGLGNYLADKRALGWDVYGVEPASNAVAICRRRGLKVSEGMFDPAKWQPDFFDTVTLLQVMEHIDDPQSLLKQIHAVLKPRGILYITVPNIRSIPAKLFTTYWIGTDVPRHYYFYTPETVSRLLINSGFKIVKWYTISSTSGYTAALEFALRERVRYRIARDRIRKHRLLSLLVLPLVRLADLANLGDNLHVIAQKLQQFSPPDRVRCGAAAFQRSGTCQTPSGKRIRLNMS